MSAIVINFTGSPGVGKSTAAHHLFSYMKLKNYKVEIIPEAAKMLTYENAELLLQDQLYVLALQNKYISLLNENHDYLIVDSPLYLSSIYGKIHQQSQIERNSSFVMPDSFFQFAMDLYNSYDNRNILLERNHEYVQLGRVHSESESNIIQSEIKIFLDKHNISHEHFITQDIEHDDINLGKMLYNFCLDKNILVK